VRAFDIIVPTLAAGLVGGCAAGAGRFPLPTATEVSQSGARHQTGADGWMLPGAKSMDLLYVSDSGDGGSLLVFSYPKGKLVGEITAPSGSLATLCSDSAGDVFVTTIDTVSQSYIYEYAHGGTTPIATLTDPGWPNGCAVDPASGNLAVANYFSDDPPYDHGNVVVYAGAKGIPTPYSDASIPAFQFCAYDDVGNLFADGGGGLAELPEGGKSLGNISLDQNIGPASIQWVAAYQALVVAGLADVGKRGPNKIYRVTVSGSTGAVTGPTLLKTKSGRNSNNVQFWTGDGRIVGPAVAGGALVLLDFWDYPRGGSPRKSVRRPDGAHSLYGVTVSRVDGKTTPRASLNSGF
jgi:hypothetical protein